VLSGGAAQCWGYNSNGRLGDGNTGTDSSVPVPVSRLGSGVTTISAGDFQTCALTGAGAAKCWGYNSNGQLGDATLTDENLPVTVI
jgi:alpha-tubulin suppressor-like RCC1 family protein